jgi:soluble lytic murein transglycosylase-like protein
MSESYASNPALALALRRGRLSDQLLADSLKPRNVGGHAGGLAQMGTALIGGVMAGLENRRIDQLLKRQEDARRQSMAQMLAGPSAPAETLAAPAAPVEMPAQSEGAMVTPAAAPSRVSAAPMPPPDLMQHFEAASTETGIPVPVLVAQARQESNFNPQARGRAGEIGVMQIMPSTARQPGFGMAGVDPAVLNDPGENIRFGARYLRARAGANADFNDPQALATALRNYNGGGDPRYVENVMRFMPQDLATPAALNPAQMPQAPAAQAPATTQPARRGSGDTVTIGGQNFSMRGIMAAMSDPDPQVSQYARTLFTSAQRQPDEFERLLNQAGIAPGSPQAQRFAQQRLERLGAPPQTNVNLPASETALLRADTDTLKAQNEAATQARGLISLFDRGEAAIKRLPTEGTAAQFLPIFGQLASSLGFKVEGSSEAEILDSITTQLAVLQRAPGSGATSDFEMRMFLRAVPQLGKTREGNLQLLDMGRRLARRRIEEANIWRRNAGAPDIMDKLDNLGPIFNEEERQMLNDAIAVSDTAAPRPGAAEPRAGQPVRVGSPDEARRLPSGTPIILPDGTQGRVP